jgi:hypothetical protein
MQKILKVTSRKNWLLDAIAPYAREAVLQTQEPREIELVLMFERPQQVRVKTIVVNENSQIILDGSDPKSIEAEKFNLPPSDLALRINTALSEIQRWHDAHAQIISMNTNTTLKFVFARARLKGLRAESHSAAAKPKGQSASERW